MAFLARNNQAQLGTPSNQGCQSRRMANHRLENGGDALECERKKAFRRGAGYCPSPTARSPDLASFPTLRGYAKILPRGHEEAAASLFCTHFCKPEGGHRCDRCEWGWF